MRSSTQDAGCVGFATHDQLWFRYAVERKHAEMAAAHRAIHDQLTGLPNRMLFVDRPRDALARSRRDQTVAAVIFLNLGDIHSVKESLGHETGDALPVERSAPS